MPSTPHTNGNHFLQIFFFFPNKISQIQTIQQKTLIIFITKTHCASIIQSNTLKKQKFFRFGMNAYLSSHFQSEEKDVCLRPDGKMKWTIGSPSIIHITSLQRNAANQLNDDYNLFHQMVFQYCHRLIVFMIRI